MNVQTGPLAAVCALQVQHRDKSRLRNVALNLIIPRVHTQESRTEGQE